MTESLQWMSPEIINIISSDEDGMESDHDEIDRIPIWEDKKLCDALINKEVIPLKGMYEGRIVSFRHIRGHRTKQNARWTVKYSRSDVESRAYRNIEYSYDEIIEIMY